MTDPDFRSDPLKDIEIVWGQTTSPSSIAFAWGLPPTVADVHSMATVALIQQILKEINANAKPGSKDEEEWVPDWYFFNPDAVSREISL